MWPWEHLAVGYLAYSAYTHLRGKGAPTAPAVVALAVGTQFPDLVDKPLAWTFGVLPSGHSLAHSLFVAVPLALLAIQVGWVTDRKAVGGAFAFGYLSHLPADVYYPLLVGGEANYGFLFWPLVPAPQTEASIGFAEMFRTLFGRYLTELFHTQLTPYLAVELGLLLSVLALWLYDGIPPLGALLRRGRTRSEETS